MMRVQSAIVLCCFVLTSMPVPALGSKRISVAVAPARAGGMESEEMAGLIGQRLSRISEHHIVERNIVRQVVDYHGGDPIAPQFAPARGYLARAQEHYFRMQYEDAAAEAERSVRLLRDDASPLHDKGQLLFDALMTQAMVARTVGDERIMRSALKGAVRLNPIRALDGTRYPPSVVKLFDAERAMLKRTGTGNIYVKTNPPVAEVYINGVASGVTPVHLNGLPAGGYDLKIMTNKYASIRRRVTVMAGRTKTVAPRLTWKGISGRRGAGRTATMGRREIDESLNVAELLKADRAVLVSADNGRAGSGMVRARLVDRRYRAAYRPIVARYDPSNREAVLDELSRTLADRIGRDLASDPAVLADPQGTADPVLLGKSRKKIYRRPLFWGAVGTVVAGAIAGGIVAAIGGGSSEDTGAVRVNFQ